MAVPTSSTVAPPSIAVTVEVGATKVFAAAFDWPGWCRSGRTVEASLDRLAQYAPRYAVVAARAGLRLPSPADRFDIVEHVPGNATTDFGAPGVVPQCHREDFTQADAARAAALVAAAWAVLDDVVAGAPAQLRKGPRGGGRDRDAIAQHVVSAEAAYARKVAVKVREPQAGDREAVEQLRTELLAAIRSAAAAPVSDRPGWPARYAAHRIAWHVLDHAWEIEDKTEAG